MFVDIHHWPKVDNGLLKNKCVGSLRYDLWTLGRIGRRYFLFFYFLRISDDIIKDLTEVIVCLLLTWFIFLKILGEGERH